jgi:hypothetical protein
MGGGPGLVFHAPLHAIVARVLMRPPTARSGAYGAPQRASTVLSGFFEAQPMAVTFPARGEVTRDDQLKSVYSSEKGPTMKPLRDPCMMRPAAAGA